MCLPNRDGRDKPGHDELRGFASKMTENRFSCISAI
jgi:hypothetical protein